MKKNTTSFYTAQMMLEVVLWEQTSFKYEELSDKIFDKYIVTDLGRSNSYKTVFVKQ